MRAPTGAAGVRPPRHVLNNAQTTKRYEDETKRRFIEEPANVFRWFLNRDFEKRRDLCDSLRFGGSQ